MKHIYCKERWQKKKKRVILWGSCFQRNINKTILGRRVWWSVRSSQWRKNKTSALKATLKTLQEHTADLKYTNIHIKYMLQYIFLKTRGMQKPLASVTLHPPDWNYRNSFCEGEKRPLLTPYATFWLNIVVLSDIAFLLAYLDWQLTAKLPFIAFCLGCI